MRILDGFRKNYVFLVLRFAPYLKYALHQGCGNALKVFLDAFLCFKVPFSTKYGIEDVQGIKLVV